MSTQRQAEIGDFLQPSVHEESSEPDEADEADGLAAIFVDVVGSETVTERQEEAPSHDPIEGEEHKAPDLTDDGLDDAADSDLNMGGFR